MEIYFVRHTSVDVPKGICYGSTDVEVSSTFIEEASKVKKELSNLKFDKVFSSPMKRAIKLASYCGFSYAEIDSRLVEFNFGDWEMQSYDSLYRKDALFRIWCNNYLNVRCPNGDSLMDQIHRVKSFISDIYCKGYNCVCVFCHGGVLAIAQSISNKVRMEDTFKKIPPYGSIIHCEFQ